jgi:hypothetical protein
MSGVALSAVYVPQPVSPVWWRRLAVAGALMVLLSSLVSGRIGPGLTGAAPSAAVHRPAADGAPAAVPAAAAAAPPVASSVTAIADRVLPVRGTTGTFEVVDPSFRTTFDGRGVHYQAAHATQPLSISLAAIARGGQAVALQPEAWRGAGAVAERTVAPAVVERATASAGQIEWDLVLSEPPSGHGDLGITAHLAGVAGAPHTVTEAGRPAVRIPVRGGTDVAVDEIVVRDATGAALYRALPTVTASALTLRVPARVLDHARYPLTVDPTVSSTITVAPPASQFVPSISSNGTQFLVVWEVLVAGFYDVYGSLVNADGTGSASTPFRISFRAGDEVLPRVAWSFNRWLVVWQYNFSSTDTDIRAQLLDGTGALKGSELPISIPTSQQRTPAVAAGIQGFLITWSDNRNGPVEIYGDRVAVDGSQLDPSGLRIDEDHGSITAATEATVPDVAWNGSKFLVVWQTKFGPDTQGNFVYQVLGRSVGADASLGFENAVALFGDANQQPKDPSVAANGSQFLVAWEQNNNIIGARVVNLDFVFTGEMIPISTANDTQDDPVVTTNGGVYFVAWRDRRDAPTNTDWDVYGARVGTDGSVKDATGISIVRFAADEQAPSVAPGASGKWGVAYQSGPNGSVSINVRLVSPK